MKRRDFLNGTLLAMGASLLPSVLWAGKTPSYYPPTLTGLRGSHTGAFEVAHALAWGGQKDFGPVSETGEEVFDLVVVGAGISGLAAARFFQDAFESENGKPPNMLILDNHDDFGGHAKRNEMQWNGTTRLGYGGSQSMESPGEYSDIVRELLADIGVDLTRFNDAYDLSFFERHGLGPVTYFDKATFGEDRIIEFVPYDPAGAIPGMPAGKLSMEDAVAKMPLEAEARKQLLRVLQGASLDEVSWKKGEAYLERTAYFQFLKEQFGVSHPQVLKVLRSISADSWAMGTDVLSVLEATSATAPGIALPREKETDKAEMYIHHFPDGNASLARLLVHRLIPAAFTWQDAPLGRTWLTERIAGATCDYHRLDERHGRVKIRLNSTVVQVANTADKQVRVEYVRDGKAHRVRARYSILACYNMMIPHIAPELSDRQKKALKSQVKLPLVYSNVLLKNWRALKKAGIGAAYCPGSFHTGMLMDFPVKLGAYPMSDSPDQPMMITLVHTPLAAQYGLPPKEQFRAGRHQLLSLPFARFEEEIIRHLNGMLGPAGFEASQDIAAITVNRWSHGYAYGGSALYDPEIEPDSGPHIVGRQRAGNITIANSDAGARAYLDAAIEQAWRAVEELG